MVEQFTENEYETVRFCPWEPYIFNMVYIMLPIIMGNITEECKEKDRLRDS